MHMQVCGNFLLISNIYCYIFVLLIVILKEIFDKIKIQHKIYNILLFYYLNIYINYNFFQQSFIYKININFLIYTPINYTYLLLTLYLYI